MAQYKVYVRRSNETTWTAKFPGASDGGTAAAGRKRPRVTGLQPSTRYCFRVAAYNLKVAHNITTHEAHFRNFHFWTRPA